MVEPISTGASAVTILDRLTAFVRWVLRRQATPLPSPRPSHSGLEVRPVRYRIDLSTVVPQIEIELLAINYLKHSLALREVKVVRFNAGGLPAIDNVPLAQEVTLDPTSSLIVHCQRALADSEARAVAAEGAHPPFTGSIGLVARALRGRKEVTYGPVADKVIGGSVVG